MRKTTRLLSAAIGTCLLTPGAAAQLASVDNVLEIEAKTVSVPQGDGPLQVPVTVVKGHSHSIVDGAVSMRAATYVFGSARPEGDPPTASQFRIVEMLVGGSETETFSAPSLVSGFAYCRLHADSETLISQLGELAQVEATLDFLDSTSLLERLRLDKRQITGMLTARSQELEDEIADSQVTRIRLNRVQAVEQPLDSGRALIWWPLMITHFIEGGVPGTDVLFQAAPGTNQDTTILRIFLIEGTTARLEWEDPEGVIQSRDLALGQYMQFQITGAQVVEEIAPTDASTDTSMAGFMTLTEQIFDAATN